ncbi:MAG: hypothetical protein H6672_11075 [Anaerolineaceae bacterium]|nr:hypothetical protein [Anaerolineaceae bacterium]
MFAIKNIRLWVVTIAALFFTIVSVRAEAGLIFSGWFSGSSISYYVPIEEGAQVVGILTCDLTGGSRPLDPILYVYSPGGSLIATNDDGYTQVACDAFYSSIVHFTAAADGDYRFVASSLSGNNGPYTLHIFGTDLAGQTASNVLDGRLNNDPVLDVAAPVAIYQNGGTYTIYAVNPDTSEGVLALRVTSRQYLAAVMVAEESGVGNYLIKSATNPFTGQLIAVYLLEDGTLQLNTAYADGKFYSISWTQSGELYHLTG